MNIPEGPVYHAGGEKYGEQGIAFTVKAASPEAVQYVLDQPENDDNGRSPFVWIWLPNGDLILGTFPQGDTFFATEEDHSS